MGVESIVNPAIKQLYGDVLCQAVSPCGNFLIAGNIFGQIFVFDLKTSLSPAEATSERVRRPQSAFSLPDEKSACSAVGTDKFLIIGSVGRLFGYDWRAICAKSCKAMQPPKLAWSWDLPLRKDELECAEVNALVVSRDNHVFVGCGDRDLYVYSLEDGRLVRSLKGHTDYIHDLCATEQDGLCSASEDGTVRLWDLRSTAARAVLHPHKESALERPQFGRWVGAVHVHKEWLVCGGGVRAGLWHLPSQALTTTFLTQSDAPCHCLLMHEERILIGDERKVSQFNLVGESVSCLACSSNTVLSLLHIQAPQKVLSIAGTSQYLDICTDLQCRDQVFCCSQPQ